MQDMADTWVKNFRPVVIKLKDGTTITGKLNIGDFPRVSDYFKKSPDQYLVLSDAEHRGMSGKVVIINKHEIMWAEPEDS
jgi:hypothetical protein